MAEAKEENRASFWEHLDVLRKSLWRVIVVGLSAAIAAFFFKEEIFTFIFAPRNSDFITYSIFDQVLSFFGVATSPMNEFAIKLINTQLTQQFIVHIRVSIYAGVLLTCPYIIYELYRFIAPALYSNEKRYTFGVVTSGYIMFLIGVAVNYYVIFPLTLKFLGTYQVSSDVTNEIVLTSYISMFMMLNIVMGVVFEIPIIGWILSRVGVINAAMLRKFRKHAIVVLLIVAAIITPTSDVVTLLMVMLPMYILYEFTILIIRLTNKKEDVKTD